MLRISTGKYKNKKLEIAKSITRPITERMRISIFDLLQEYIKNASVLDLYAGSGAMGLEALSRGAAQATFIEKDKTVYNTILQNIQKVEPNERTNILLMNASEFIENSFEKFDLIFLDPPFFKNKYTRKKKVIDISNLYKLTTENTIIILRVEATIYKHKQINYSGLNEIFQKKYGRSTVVFYSR